MSSFMRGLAHKINQQLTLAPCMCIANHSLGRSAVRELKDKNLVSLLDRFAKTATVRVIHLIDLPMYTPIRVVLARENLVQLNRVSS